MSLQMIDSRPVVVLVSGTTRRLRDKCMYFACCTLAKYKYYDDICMLDIVIYHNYYLVLLMKLHVMPVMMRGLYL